MACIFKLEKWLTEHKPKFVTSPGSCIKRHKQRSDTNENVKKSKSA